MEEKSEGTNRPKVNWDELDERDENRKHLYLFGLFVPSDFSSIT